MPDRPPKELSQLWGPEGVIYLPKDDADDFKAWLTLSREEKRGLIEMAENHKFILMAATTFMWLGITWKVMLGASMFATAVMAIYGAIKLMGVLP